MTAYPALYIVSAGGMNELPPQAEIVETVTEAAEAEGWDGRDLIDARHEEVLIQDEVPPNDPIYVEGVVLVYDQTQLLHPSLYRVPFEIAVDALHDTYGKSVEVWLDGYEISPETSS